MYVCMYVYYIYMYVRTYVYVCCKFAFGSLPNLFGSTKLVLSQNIASESISLSAVKSITSALHGKQKYSADRKRLQLYICILSVSITEVLSHVKGHIQKRAVLPSLH